jgi:hypothetical protein
MQNTEIQGLMPDMSVRADALQRSIILEDSINSLLLFYLGIEDKESTKHFGKKAGISFKSKVELLYDIGVLLKEELLNFELLMVFRNKFAHDIKSDSFTSVIDQLDNGVRNRFNKFIPNQSDTPNERTYEKAFNELFITNIKVIKLKYADRRIHIKNKADLLKGYADKSARLIDLAFGFIERISLDFEEYTLTKNPDLEITATVLKRIIDFQELLRNDEDMSTIDKQLDTNALLKSILK